MTSIQGIHAVHQSPIMPPAPRAWTPAEAALSLIAVSSVLAAILFWWNGVERERVLFTLTVSHQEISITLPLFLFTIGIAVGLVAALFRSLSGAFTVGRRIPGREQGDDRLDTPDL